jgi:hypothetical protein
MSASNTYVIVLVKSDVIGVITSVTSVEHIQTMVRVGESLRRNVMVRLPR